MTTVFVKRFPPLTLSFPTGYCATDFREIRFFTLSFIELKSFLDADRLEFAPSKATPDLPRVIL